MRPFYSKSISCQEYGALPAHHVFIAPPRGLHQVKGCVATLVARVGFGTIRGRILIAFLMMSLITGALGVYATFGIARSGDLVAKTFDGSLMGINYARAAAADFANMRAAFARRWIATDPSVRDELDGKIDDLEKSLKEDLEIAAARSQSQRAAKAASRVKGAVSRGARRASNCSIRARAFPGTPWTIFRTW